MTGPERRPATTRLPHHKSKQNGSEVNFVLLAGHSVQGKEFNGKVTHCSLHWRSLERSLFCLTNLTVWRQSVRRISARPSYSGAQFPLDSRHRRFVPTAGPGSMCTARGFVKRTIFSWIQEDEYLGSAREKLQCLNVF